MTVRDELEKSLARACDAYSDPDYHYAANFLRDHGPALLEALENGDRWLKVRNAPLGVSGVLCLAMPKDHRNGEYVNGEDADAAVDGLSMPDLTDSLESRVRSIIDTHEAAKAVRSYNPRAWDEGYAFAVDSICGDLADALDTARRGGG